MIYDWRKCSFASDEFILEYTAKIYVPPMPKGAWANNYEVGQEWISFGRQWGISAGGGPTYYGTLKRWTGAMWVKEPLKVYISGSWQVKAVYRWDGSSWKLIDTTG